MLEPQSRPIRAAFLAEAPGQYWTLAPAAVSSKAVAQMERTIVVESVLSTDSETRFCAAHRFYYGL